MAELPSLGELFTDVRALLIQIKERYKEINGDEDKHQTNLKILMNQECEAMEICEVSFQSYLEAHRYPDPEAIPPWFNSLHAVNPCPRVPWFNDREARETLARQRQAGPAIPESYVFGARPEKTLEAIDGSCAFVM